MDKCQRYQQAEMANLQFAKAAVQRILDGSGTYPPTIKISSLLMAHGTLRLRIRGNKQCNVGFVDQSICHLSALPKQPGVLVEYFSDNPSGSKNKNWHATKLQYLRYLI